MDNLLLHILNVLVLSVSHQGFAYTFITDDQARYAGEIVKALELSVSPVPPELEKLWSTFKDQQKAVRNPGSSWLRMIDF